MGSLVFLFHTLLFLECFLSTEANRKVLKETPHHHLRLPHSSDPQLRIFFHYNTLEIGKKLPLYFPNDHPSTAPPLLSQHQSDSIPFSSSKLPDILNFFSFTDDSKQAESIKSTLEHCEFPPMIGESKFCATSLESLLDSVQGIFGLDTKFKVVTTNYLTVPTSPLQNYTVVNAPKEISVPKMVGCHTLPYPYLVYYCHGQNGDNKLYKVTMKGDDGAEVDAMGICHMDTSQWDPSHVAFRVLATIPGASPVCHFFPPDNLVWIPKV